VNGAQKLNGAALQLLALASPPATIEAHAPLAEAARRMGRSHVGSLVVLEDGAPVGLVTDRDIALAACLAPRGEAPPLVGAVASRPLVTLSKAASLDELTQLCAVRCIRRVGLVDDAGELVGVVSTDSVVQHLGRQMGELARTFQREFEAEREPAHRPVTFGPE
jgi:CBS domain-containing protein